MKNLLTALLCRLLVAAFCSSGGGLLSPSWVADAAPRESDGGAGAGGADKGKDANKTTRPNEPGRDGQTLLYSMAFRLRLHDAELVHDAFGCSVEGTSCEKWNCQPENDLATYIPR